MFFKLKVIAFKSIGFLYFMKGYVKAHSLFCHYIDGRGRRETPRKCFAFPSCSVLSRKPIQFPAKITGQGRPLQAHSAEEDPGPPIERKSTAKFNRTNEKSYNI
ncbi:hypothetical protein CVD28_21575 [Bacillus sp. M6-12]|nr:hypothetical protein CVD28_21575 [Bacillus sp. M6-12]